MREEMVPCSICGNPTNMLGTKLCGPCWELSRLILHYREQAKKILENTKWREDDK